MRRLEWKNKVLYDGTNLNSLSRLMEMVVHGDGMRLRAENMVFSSVIREGISTLRSWCVAWHEAGLSQHSSFRSGIQ